MKQILRLIILCALFCIVSCAKQFDASKEDESINKNGKIEYSIIANAPEYQEGATGTKGSLGAVARVKWAYGDKIMVLNINGTAVTKLGILTADLGEGEEATSTTFTGTITEATTGNTAYIYQPGITDETTYSETYSLSSQDYSGNARTVFCAYANETGSVGTSITKKTIKFSLATSYVNINMANLGSGYPFSTLKINNIASDVKWKASGSTLEVSSDATQTSSITVNITNTDKKILSSTKGFAVVCVAIPVAANVSSTTYTRTIQAGYLQVDFDNLDFPAGSFINENISFSSPTPILSGPFTVAEGRTVYFAPANLYWNGSNYHFESSQTDYPTSWNASHVGHFFWTNRTDYKTSGMEPYASSYSYSSQSESDKFWCGKGNELTVDGTSGWYTLTKDEWVYLFGIDRGEQVSGRTNASSLYKKGVTVTNNGTSYTCLIIAPDDYDYTTTPLTTGPYTLAELNAAGIVCLPASGTRNGSSFEDTGDYGYCWSATPDPTDARGAYYMVFHSSYIYPEWCYFRHYGCSLRLVRD